MNQVTLHRYLFLDSEKYKRELSRVEKAEYLAFKFRKLVGYEPNFDKAITYNEKLNWLKLNYYDPLESRCADKASMPKFVEERLPELAEHCVTPIAIFKKPEDLDTESLAGMPENFVLKSNFGSGSHIFVKKSASSISHLRGIIEAYIQPARNHYYFAFEPSYKYIEPAVVCEPVLDFKYKIEFFCFDGEPSLYWIIINDKSERMCINLYDIDGKRLPAARKNYPNFAANPMPPFFEQLLYASRILSAGFPHVRVDFYAGSNTWHFSEMTFFPGSGLVPFTPHEFDIKLGSMLNLDKWCDPCA